MATYKRKRAPLYSRAAKRRRLYKKARRIISRKRRRISRSVISAGRMSYGFPERKVVRCKWIGMETISVAATTQLTITGLTGIQMGSAYDPWQGITGQFNVTPAGFDLHSQIYNRYIVLGAKLVATFRPTTFNTNDIFDTPFKVGLKKNTMATLGTLSTWAEASTDPDTKVKTLIASRARPSSATVVMTYSPRKEYGIKDIRDALLTTTGANAQVNGNPTFGTFAIPWYQCFGTNNVINYAQEWIVEFKLYQKVLFYDRKDLGGLANADSLIQD